MTAKNNSAKSLELYICDKDPEEVVKVIKKMVFILGSLADVFPENL